MGWQIKNTIVYKGYGIIISDINNEKIIDEIHDFEDGNDLLHYNAFDPDWFFIPLGAERDRKLERGIRYNSENNNQYIPPSVIPLLVNEKNILIDSDKEEAFILLKKIYEDTLGEDYMRTKIFLEENQNTWTFGEYLVIFYNEYMIDENGNKYKEEIVESSEDKEILFSESEGSSDDEKFSSKEEIKEKEIMIVPTKISKEDQKKVTFQTKNLRAKKL